MRKNGQSGFSLAELLLALLILGQIAVFTIPKVLTTQQKSANVAKGKEVASMIAGAFLKAQTSGEITSTTVPANLIKYMNYVSINTTGALVDAHPGWTGYAGGGLNNCVAVRPCLKLHNGGILWLHSTSFGGTTPLHVIDFGFDPDGTGGGGTADGPGKTVQFSLYYNGFLTTRGQNKTGSCSSNGCGLNEPNASLDPSWFSW